MSFVSQNLKDIQASISAACTAHGRDPADVHLVAVSKKQPQARIAEALTAGHRVFGENRVQEAQTHWADVKAQYPDVQLHLIGPLQTNKAKDAVALFDVIQTVDREKLARILGQEMDKQDKSISCFVQVNTGEEPQKSGVLPHDVPDFLAFCRSKCGLNIRGLMCIPPVDEPPALHFALLKQIAEQQDLPDLSMGMSADYERAIAVGATHVRVGTAVFGGRV